MDDERNARRLREIEKAWAAISSTGDLVDWHADHEETSEVAAPEPSTYFGGRYFGRRYFGGRYFGAAA